MMGEESMDTDKTVSKVKKNARPPKLLRGVNGNNFNTFALITQYYLNLIYATREATFIR